MTIEDIKSLPVGDLAAKNCILFLWSTGPLQQEARNALEAWGFKYKTIGFIWNKLNKKVPTRFMGMGSYTRASAEFILIGIKGKTKNLIAQHNIFQSQSEPIEKHSKKPDIFRELIEQLCVNKKRIELFASKKVKGWDSIGFDIDGKDIKESLTEIINNFSQK